MQPYRKLILLTVLGSLFILIAGCSDDNATGPTNELPDTTAYTDITAAEAQMLKQTNPDLVIIDVSPMYDNGHIPGAVNHVFADGSLDEAIPTLDKTASYLIYCHSAPPSIASAQKLIGAGFTEVYRLEGNFAAWVAAGYDVEP